ncbi:c-type cytochrome [Geobacter argillaceus]|uniref:Cytochrome c n=1 Tax=Geobacter argillaceus TaxID=345631 RepID=A0A562VGP8_9BACT|nr:cytochrome c [Geobacter argillaceus]TWJ17048.1 cytochrome c [Geobacter argillaceus]
MRNGPKSVPLLLILTLVLPALAVADAGKELFDRQCASCHTIGGGDSGGPDLKGVTARHTHEWLETVIMEPDKLMARKDPAQAGLVKKYGYEMPKLGIGHDDALKIITYLGAADGATAAKVPVPATEQLELVVTPELIAHGKALFTGRKRLANGGAACVACHQLTYPGIAGGNLSIANLGVSYRKMGETGMRGALKALKFLTMKRIYQDRPLTDEEVAALLALYKDAAGRQQGGTSAYPLAGAGLFVLFMLGLTLYKRRIR